MTCVVSPVLDWMEKLLPNCEKLEVPRLCPGLLCVCAKLPPGDCRLASESSPSSSPAPKLPKFEPSPCEPPCSDPPEG